MALRPDRSDIDYVVGGLFLGSLHHDFALVALSILPTTPASALLTIRPRAQRLLIPLPERKYARFDSDERRVSRVLLEHRGKPRAHRDLGALADVAEQVLLYRNIRDLFVVERPADKAEHLGRCISKRHFCLRPSGAPIVWALLTGTRRACRSSWETVTRRAWCPLWPGNAHSLPLGRRRYKVRLSRRSRVVNKRCRCLQRSFEPVKKRRVYPAMRTCFRAA